MEVRYKEPRLEFRSVTNHPLALEYALAYYPGCFTPTGLSDRHTKEIKQWCKDNITKNVDYQVKLFFVDYGLVWIAKYSCRLL